MSVITCSINAANPDNSYKKMRNNAKLFSCAFTSIEAKKYPKFETCCWVFSDCLPIQNCSFSPFECLILCLVFALWMDVHHATTVRQFIKLEVHGNNTVGNIAAVEKLLSMTFLKNLLKHIYLHGIFPVPKSNLGEISKPIHSLWRDASNTNIELTTRVFLENWEKVTSDGNYGQITLHTVKCKDNLSRWLEHQHKESNLLTSILLLFWHIHLRQNYLQQLNKYDLSCKKKGVRAVKRFFPWWRCHPKAC